MYWGLAKCKEHMVLQVISTSSSHKVECHHHVIIPRHDSFVRDYDIYRLIKQHYLWVSAGLPIRHTYSVPIQGTDTVYPVKVITVPPVDLRWHSYLPSGSTVPAIASGGNRKPCYSKSKLQNPNRCPDDPSGVFLYNFLPTLVKQVQQSQDPKYPSRRIIV